MTTKPNQEIVFGNGIEGVEELVTPFEKVYFPDWNNRPPELPPILSLNGVGILTHQNLSAIIAPQGAGKSSICEAIGASHLNPECDALGFEVSSLVNGVVIIDFERTNTDVWNSFYRIARRSGIENGNPLSNIKIAGMRSIPRLQERKDAIVKILDENPCGLLVMDGAGDLITDSNDLPQAIECRIWIRELTVKYNLAIFTTLHPNPGTLKPRGHIGSEIMREAEAVMAIQKKENIKIIFSEFDHGKNRNGAAIWGAYDWDDSEMMHCKREVPEYMLTGKPSSKRKKQKAPSEFTEAFHIDLLKTIFSQQEHLKSGEFHNNIKAVWNIEENDNMNKSRAEEFRSYYVLQDYLLVKTKQAGNVTLNGLSDKVLYPKRVD